MTLANRVPPCGTCGGVPHVSGLPCVCDGANTVYAEVQGLRQQLIGAQAEVGKLRRETVAQAAGWEREMDKWRARVRELEEALEDVRQRGRLADHSHWDAQGTPGGRAPCAWSKSLCGSACATPSRGGRHE